MSAAPRAPRATARAALALGVVALSVLLASDAAHAHERDPSRSIVLQIDREGVAVLWRVTLAGRDARLLFAGADRDHDGSIDPQEGRAVAGRILAPAMREVHWARGGKAWKYGTVEPAIEPGARPDAIVAVALATFAGDPLASGETVTLRMVGAPLSLWVQARDGFALERIADATIAPNRTELSTALILQGERAIDITVSRP